MIYGATCNGRQADKGKHPMNCVALEEARAYCAFRGARLPSEAEWEYAARGKKLVGGFPWGATKPSTHVVNACDLDCMRWSRRNQAGLDALVNESDGFATTAPVGSFPAGCSAFGVCELADDVREWTDDAYADYSVGDAAPPGPDAERVVRGGAWTSGDALELRRTHREGLAPSARRHDVGFRCARSPH